jgi:hypothetical protein
MRLRAFGGLLRWRAAELLGVNVAAVNSMLRVKPATAWPRAHGTIICDRLNDEIVELLTDAMAVALLRTSTAATRRVVTCPMTKRGGEV